MLMDDLDENERNHVASVIAWLRTADPDDWHRVALDFNWGEPLYVLDWIVSQAECDVATALTIFWKGEPGCWLEERGSRAEQPNGFSYLNRKICAEVANRVAAEGYKRSRIAFAPETWTKQDYVELAAQSRDLDAPSFLVDPALIGSRSGRRVVNDAEFYARYPADFRHTFDCELPEETPRSASVMQRVKLVEQKTWRLLPTWLRS